MPRENQPVISFNDQEAQNDGLSVFVTGHMIDKPERTNPRFPSESMLDIRGALWSNLNEVNDKDGIRRLICSGTAGVDLLAVEWILPNNIEGDLYLPYDLESFVEHAVAYGDLKEYWAKIFSRAERSPKVRLHTPSLSDGSFPTRKRVEELSEQSGDAYQHYVDLNVHMVNRLKPNDLVIAYWDGKGGDAPGGTEHAVRLAAQRGANYVILNNGIKNVAERYPL